MCLAFHISFSLADSSDMVDISLTRTLVQHVCHQIADKTLTDFIRRFLLESNATAVRWQAHSLVHSLYK